MKYVKLNLTEELVKCINYEGNGSDVRNKANLWLEAEAIFYDNKTGGKYNE